MRITVEVKAGAREDRVEKTPEGHYLVSVKEQPKKGKANISVTKLLKKHLGKQVMLVSGATSSTKIFEIEE
jgi:uncharacterized protein YggU (UPF0235/DUF167 family)